MATDSFEPGGEDQSRRPWTVLQLAEMLAVGLAYFAAGKLALLLAIPPGYATAIWPAAGLALGSVLVFGNRVWPGIAIGSLIVNIGTSFDAATMGTILKSISLPAVIGTGAALQALTGAFLVRRYIGMPTALSNEKEVIRFSILASISCVVAATLGVVSLRLAGAIPRGDFLINWATWWVGDTIGTLIFAPLVIIWSFGVRYARRKLSVSVPMALAFAIVVALFFQTSRWEQDHIKLDFNRRADALTGRLQRDFEGYVGVLRSIQGFFASSSSVDWKSFHTFVARDFSDHPGIQALSWNPRVQEAERTAFEESARRDGAEAFQITEHGTGSNLIRAGSRDEYVPVRYLEPSAGNERALGFDTASDPIRRKAMERSRDSGKPVATEKITLLQDVGRSCSFVVYLAIYSSDVSNTTAERRRRELQGYVAAVFRIGDVINQSLNGIDRNGIELRLVDETAPLAKQFLFGTSSDAKTKTALQRKTQFAMAGRKWALEFSLSPEYLMANRSWQSWSVLAGGLLFTALLGAFLLVVTGHRDRDEVLVAARTSDLTGVNAILHREIADRTTVENELRLSEARFRSVTQSVADAIVSANGEGNIILWNSAAEEIFGYNQSEVIGKPLTIIMPERYREMHRVGADAESRMINKTVELEGLRKDGSEFPVELTLSTWATNEGTFYTGVLRDITNRKEAEDRLKRSESRLTEAQKVAHIGSWEWDVTKNKVFWSDEEYRLLGFAPGGVTASYDRFLASVHPDDQPQTRRWMKELLVGKESSSIEQRIIRPNGETRLLHNLANTVLDPAGNVLRIVGTSQDITEQKKSEQKFKGLLESAPDAMVIVDGHGAIALVNSQTEKLFGYKREELLGEKIEILMPQRFRENHPGRRDGFFHSPRHRPMGAGLELFGQRKDETEFPIEISLSPLETEDGVLAMAAIRDITERKRTERDLHAAKEEADRANKAKSEFLSRMSHELRTPLNAILGFGQLLERQTPTEPQRTRLAHITSAGRHLLKLINEILDISRIEAGNLQLSLEPVSVADILAEAVDLMRPLAADRAIEVETPARSSPPVYVLADPQRFKQVLLNFLSNAVKYSPVKGTVTTSYRSSGRGTMQIVVRDTGAGIASDKLGRLFTPFDRLGAEQSTVEGTGLGLALSQRLMHAMGGGIGASSTVGRGSTFWVELPRAEPPADFVSAPESHSLVHARVSCSGKCTILYIEDNLSNLTLVEEILSEQPQIELLSAMQGRLGLDLARKHSPDLILLDLHLPDLAGPEVLSQLQADETTRHIPVIVISADATARQIERLMTAGAQDYLTKPLDVAKFSRIVEETATRHINRVKHTTLDGRSESLAEVTQTT